MEIKEKQNQPKSVGFFTLSMIVIGSMIGAGLLVVPNKMMSYGFGGTLGWLLAGTCSLILAKIFTNLSLSSSSQGSLSVSIGEEYGSQTGFISAFAQSVYIILGSTAILFGLMSYLCEFYNLTSNVTQFLISATIILSIYIMHAFTSGAMKLMSLVTILKILLFGFCAFLGIIDFNAVKVFGFQPTGNMSQNLFNTVNLNGGLNLVFSMLGAASAAMFAFAGIENVASMPNVRNPKKNVPAASLFGLLITSIIYFFTHVCVVSASGAYSATPVKSALVMLSSRRFGEPIGFALGSFVSVVAVLGCFGTLLALGSILPHLLLSAAKIANQNFKTPLSRTGTPYVFSIFSVIPILIMVYMNYIMKINLNEIFLIANFMLIYFYLQCVLTHCIKFKNRPLEIFGLAATGFLLLGSSPQGVLYGVMIIELIGKPLFILMSK